MDEKPDKPENKKQGKNKPPANLSLEKIKNDLENATRTLAGAFANLMGQKDQRRVSEDLLLIEENLKTLVLMLRSLNEKLRKTRGGLNMHPDVKKPAQPFISKKECKDILKGKKNIVYYHNSDFSSLEEYIEYMRRPLISREEAKSANWDRFLDDLNNWKGAA